MKRLFIVFSIVLFFLLLVLLIGGPFYAKYYINKNGKELSGRHLHLDGLVFNALNGHLTLRDFTFFEKDDSTAFVSFDTLYIDIEIYKLFSSELFIDEIKLSHPMINVTLENEAFNFDDLIPKPDSSEQIENNKEITKYTFNNITIKRGYVDFNNLDMKANHTIKDLNIEIPGISWGKDKADAGLLFALDKGGSFRTDFHFDKSTNYFSWNLEVLDLNLKNVLPYVQNYAKVNDINGDLNGYISVFGNLDSIDAVDFVTRINVNNFNLIDQLDKDFIGFKQLEVLSDTINAAKLKFNLDSITLNAPYISYTIDKDSVSNFDKILIYEANESDSLEKDTSLAQLSYYVNYIRIFDGSIKYKDETLKPEIFEYSVTDITFAADKIKEGSYVSYDLSAHLNGDGRFNGDMHFDPKDPGNGSFNLSLKDVEIKDFSPFSLSNFAYPINKGRLNFSTKNKVKDRYLNSHVVLDLFAIELGEKNKNFKSTYNVPLKLGLVILRDPKGRINFDVPAEGDINSPDFKYRKVIFKVLLNVIIKAAVSPYNLLAQSIGSDEESIKKIHLDKGQDFIGPVQSSQLDLIARLINEKQGLEAKITLHVDEESEKEFLLIRHAKKKFYTYSETGSDESIMEYNETDWAKIDGIENDNFELISYLQNKTLMVDESDIIILSNALLSKELVEIQYKKLLLGRIEMIRLYNEQKHDSIPLFINNEWVDEKKVGLPYYLLEYDVAD